MSDKSRPGMRKCADPEKEKSVTEKSENPSKSDLTIKAIDNGTVIDHITRGQAFNVLRILGIDASFRNTVSMVVNAEGAEGGKDVVKIQGMELTEKQVAAISLIAPKATVNIIRDYCVVRKSPVRIPDQVSGFVKCVNPNCISNSNEPIDPAFFVIKTENGHHYLRCRYCESRIGMDMICHIISD